MKKIIFLTDYSPYAAKALSYAVPLAQNMHAALHVCHVPEILPAGTFADLAPIAEEDTALQMQQAKEKLQHYAHQISTDRAFNIGHLPISWSIETGTVKSAALKVAKAQKASLIVMGLVGGGTLNRFLLGSNSRDLIEDAPVPVLLVPKESNYQPFKKIGFATDLTESDLNAIHEVARLFSMFNPELLLTHVSPLPSDFHDPRTPANQFLNQVTGKINYSKIYYRHITEAAIHKGLLWVTEHGRIDLLAMIHRKHSGLSNLLRSSYTKKVADLITLPLLIMPENHEPISW